MIRLLTGDVRDMLTTLPDASVQCVVTSPPYYGLRDYGTAQWEGGAADCQHKVDIGARASSGLNGSLAHKDGRVFTPYRSTCGKCGARRIDRQLGLEPTPDEYIQTMVQVFRDVRRVLRDDGTCWLNLGDSMSSGGNGPGSGKQLTNVGANMPPKRTEGLAAKQLLMMPARLALALQADGWWLRSDIIWAKPNPMPESVTDRPTSAHEHVFLLTKAARYFFDSEAVREPQDTMNPAHPSYRAIVQPGFGSPNGAARQAERGAQFGVRTMSDVKVLDPRGRNLRNVWTIATAPFPAAHFATFPPELAERCIRAGTSERGCCAQCGKPWVRVTSVSYTDAGNGNNNMARKGGDPAAAMSARPYEVRKLKDVETTGWSPGCQCNAEVVPCTVLDCFSGAGTALLVADRLGRDAVGIDLSHAYVEMARERLQADCPLFADITDAPVPEHPEENAIADLFAEAAE